MPIVETTDRGGVIHRRFVAQTTPERRRDRAVRAELRRLGVRPDPDRYAALFELTAEADPAEAAFAYVVSLAAAAGGRCRPGALGPRTRLGAALRSIAAGMFPPAPILPDPE